jgi:serine protease Do
MAYRPCSRALRVLATLAFSLPLAAGALLASEHLLSAAGPLPALPPSGSAPSAPPGSPVAPPQEVSGDAKGPASDEPKKGIVLVEQGGRLLAIGTILKGDGRVVTSLSALGGLEQVDVRYTDGTLTRARLAHKDRTWDLALLVPLTGKWVEGFLASEQDPASVELRALSVGRGRPPTLPVIHFKSRTDARGKDGEPVPSALDLDLRGASVVAGTPILDPNGNVLALLVHACKAQDGGPCAPITVGAPVFALRSFLVKTPQNAVQPAPWLGIGGASAQSGNTKGVRVMAVAPQSPAEAAGLKADPASSDLIVAVDGQPVGSPDELAKQIGQHAVGQTIKLLVFGAEKFREVQVTLKAAP